MFWKTEICEAVTLSDLLKKENVTVEEILEDEFSLQELKNNNRELIDFLTSPEQIQKLVQLSLSEPPETDDIFNKNRFRYAHLASELVSSNSAEISSSVISNDTTRTLIGNFLTTPPPLNPLLISFYSKIVTQLQSRQPKEILDILKESKTFINDAMSHMSCSAVADLLFNLVTVPNNDEDANMMKEWLCEEKFAFQMSSLFVPSVDADSHSNIAFLWSELVRILRDILYNAEDKIDDCLLNALQGREALTELLNKMLDKEASESVVVNGAEIFLTLLRTHHIPNNPLELSERAANPNRWRGGVPGGDDPDKLLIEAPDGEFWSPDTHRIAESVLANRLSDIHKFLLEQKPVTEFTCLSSRLKKPLGAGRLAIAKLLVTLLNSNVPEVHDSFCHLAIVHTLLRWLSEFQWNNLLHSTVVQCVTCVLFSRLTTQPTADSEAKVVWSPLIRHLLIDCDLIGLLIGCTERNEQNAKKHSCHSCIGHLFQMASQLQIARLRGPNKEAINSILEEKDLGDKWMTFVESVLIPYQEANEPDNVDLPVSQMANIADEDFIQVPTSSSAAGQMQTMTHPLNENFALPMDTFTSEGENPIDILASHTRTLDFNPEMVLQDTPPGEAAFEEICRKRLGGGDVTSDQSSFDPFGLGTKDESWTDASVIANENWARWDNVESGNPVIVQNMEVDELPENNKKKAPERRDSEDWANFEDSPQVTSPGDRPPPFVPPSDNWAEFDKLASDGSADWAISSPASQGLAIATFGNWPIDPVLASPTKSPSHSSTPPKSPRGMIVTLPPEQAANGPTESNC